jgi:hypothetical protein
MSHRRSGPSMAPTCSPRRRGITRAPADPRFSARFDPDTWSADLARSTPAGHAAAQAARREYERNGSPPIPSAPLRTRRPQNQPPRLRQGLRPPPQRQVELRLPGCDRRRPTTAGAPRARRAPPTQGRPRSRRLRHRRHPPRAHRHQGPAAHNPPPAGAVGGPRHPGHERLLHAWRRRSNGGSCAQAWPKFWREPAAQPLNLAYLNHFVNSGTGTRTPNSTSRVSRVTDYTIPDRRPRIVDGSPRSGAQPSAVPPDAFPQP